MFLHLPDYRFQLLEARIIASGATLFGEEPEDHSESISSALRERLDQSLHLASAVHLECAYSHRGPSLEVLQTEHYINL